MKKIFILTFLLLHVHIFAFSQPWLILKNNHPTQTITCAFFFIVNIGEGIEIFDTPDNNFHLNVNNINPEQNLMQVVGTIELLPQKQYEISHIFWTKNFPVAPTIDFIQTQIKESYDNKIYYFLGHNSNWRILNFDITTEHKVSLLPILPTYKQQLRWITQKPTKPNDTNVFFKIQST